MNNAENEGVVHKFNKHKKKGVVVVALCVLACKIPLLIALFGLGGLSWVGLGVPMSPILQIIALIVGIIGILAICGYLAHRVYSKVVE